MASTTLAAPITAVDRDRSDLIKVTNDICYTAGQEIAAIASMLKDRRDDTSEFSYLLHGSLMRIAALGTAVCCTLGNDDRDEVAENYAVVFGEKLEAAHD